MGHVAQPARSQVPGTTYWYGAVTVTKAGTELDNNGGKCYSVTVPPV